MKHKITKFSVKKAEKAAINSSKIEGHKASKSSRVKIKASKIASTLCP